MLNGVGSIHLELKGVPEQPLVKKAKARIKRCIRIDLDAPFKAQENLLFLEMSLSLDHSRMTQMDRQVIETCALSMINQLSHYFSTQATAIDFKKSISCLERVLGNKVNLSVFKSTWSTRQGL